MNKFFISRCDKELKNNKHKGDWDKWTPNVKEACQELNWHIAKLNHRMLDGDPDGMMELSADVANICEKVFILAKKAKRRKKKMTDFYGDFIGWDYGDFINYEEKDED